MHKINNINFFLQDNIIRFCNFDASIITKIINPEKPIRL